MGACKDCLRFQKTESILSKVCRALKILQFFDIVDIVHVDILAQWNEFQDYI